MSPGDRSRITTTRLVVTHQTSTGPVTALDHPGLFVAAGASMAIMGPSGCGKSTLLGLLGGLARPTRGTVTIGGTELSALSDRQRARYRRANLGMVFQADNLLPHLTVEENIAVPLSFGPSGGPGEPGRLIEALGLDGLATRLPDQLSGGQRQRVAVARAVVHRPAVILADEPTGALDEANAEGVIEVLIEAQASIGATLVLVTHDPSVATKADRVELLGPAVVGTGPRVGVDVR